MIGSNRKTALLMVANALEQLVGKTTEIVAGEETLTIPESPMTLEIEGEHYDLPDDWIEYAALTLREVAKGLPYKYPVNGKGGPRLKGPGPDEIFVLQARHMVGGKFRESGELMRYLEAHYPQASRSTLEKAAAKVLKGKHKGNSPVPSVFD